MLGVVALLTVFRNLASVTITRVVSLEGYLSLEEGIGARGPRFNLHISSGVIVGRSVLAGRSLIPTPLQHHPTITNTLLHNCISILG